jgi:hypothetical protein
MAFFTQESKGDGNYSARIDLNKIAIPKSRVVTYEVPEETLRRITERLNELLPGTTFKFNTGRIDEKTINHVWSTGNTPRGYTILVEISIRTNRDTRIVGTVMVLARNAFPSKSVFEGFVERVKKIIQGDTSETGPFVSDSAPAEDTEDKCGKSLASAGITSRSDFRKWSLQNHPDRGGDTTKFQEISACVDTVFPSGGRRKSRRKNRKARKTRRRL